MRRIIFVLGALAVTTLALANSNWQFAFKKMSGSYAIYGSGLGDPIAPSVADKKIAVVIKGAAAREIFDAIGPDVQDECLEKPDRVRKRDADNFICMRVGGEYSCKFGFDLVTGRSIGGSIC